MHDNTCSIETDSVDTTQALPDCVAGFFRADIDDEGPDVGDDFEDDGWVDDYEVPVANEDFDPVIYFDPARFSHPDALDNLEGLVRARRPAGEERQWYRIALTAETLRAFSPFATAREESRFMARGYSTELECRDEQMKEVGQTDQHRAALDALHHASVVAEIVILSVKEIMGADCPAWLNEHPAIVLGPMLGRMSFAIAGGPKKVHEVPLVGDGELLMGCRDFHTPRRVYFAEKCSFEQARRYGRENFTQMSEVDHNDYVTIVKGELASEDRYGRKVHLPGVALWACQQVARLRIAAGDAFIKSSRAWKKRDYPTAMAIQRNCFATRIQKSYDEVKGFRSPDIYFLEYGHTLVGIVETALSGIWPVIDGEGEADTDRTLCAVADWVGRVRRWGFANLDYQTAYALLALLGRFDPTSLEALDTVDGKAALQRLENLLPEAMWEEIEAASLQVVEDRRSRAVMYDWNAEPLVAVDLETGRAPIIGRGPLLDFPAYDSDRWARLARTIGPQGLMVA